MRASVPNRNRIALTCDSILEFRVAASGMGWKGVDSEGQTLLSSANIKWAQWLRVARNFQLRVGLKDRKKVTFDGFVREVSRGPMNHHERLAYISGQDHDKLASLLKQHFAVTLEVKDVSVKGWNWGVTDFQGVSDNFVTITQIFIS